MNFLAIDLDARGSYVIGNDDGTLVAFGPLAMPQKQRDEETFFHFLRRRVFALAKIIKLAKRYGVKTIFVEHTDWALPVYGQRARINAWQNRKVAFALGRLEGMLFAIATIRRIEYVLIGVRAAKYAVTHISGKKGVKKEHVQRIVLSFYPQLDQVKPDDLKQSCCDAMSVLWAGLLVLDPLFYLRFANSKENGYEHFRRAH